MSKESKIMTIIAALCLLTFCVSIIRAAYLVGEVWGLVALACVAAWMGRCASSIVNDLKKEREESAKKTEGRV